MKIIVWILPIGYSYFGMDIHGIFQRFHKNNIKNLIVKANCESEDAQVRINHIINILINLIKINICYYKMQYYINF